MDLGMFFELTIRLFVGDKAYHIAGQEGNEKARREWLRKISKIIIKRIEELDTTTRHKERLHSEAEKLLELLNSSKTQPWQLVYVLFRLTGRLLGFDFVKGALVHTPVYHQNKAQYYTSAILSGGDALQDYYDGKDAISVRRRLVHQLREEGFDDFKISLVLNTSEYQVKKLRKDL